MGRGVSPVGDRCTGWGGRTAGTEAAPERFDETKKRSHFADGAFLQNKMITGVSRWGTGFTGKAGRNAGLSCATAVDETKKRSHFADGAFLQNKMGSA